MATKNKKSHWTRRMVDPFWAKGSTLAERISAPFNDALLLTMGAGLFKEGGRVTKRKGCGIAKRGFGRAMRKK